METTPPITPIQNPNQVPTQNPVSAPSIPPIVPIVPPTTHAQTPGTSFTPVLNPVSLVKPRKKIPKWMIIVIVVVILLGTLGFFYKTIITTFTSMLNSKKNMVDSAIVFPVDVKNPTNDVDKKIPLSLPNTFQSKGMGYEIKYPRDWTYESEIEASTGMITIHFYPEKPNYIFTVIVSKIKLVDGVFFDVSLNNLINSLKYQADSSGGKYGEIQDVSFKAGDGREFVAKKFEMEYINNKMTYRDMSVFIKNGVDLFWVESVSGDKDHKIQDDITNQMLNSLIIK